MKKRNLWICGLAILLVAGCTSSGGGKGNPTTPPDMTPGVTEGTTPTAEPTAAGTKEFDEEESTVLYEKGNFATDYSKIISRHTDSSSRAWRDGMVSGNGEIGYVTSGEPYSDAFIFQNIFFNYPSSQPREIPKELTAQLEEARENVFNLNDEWKILDANGNVRGRTFFYSFHPGHQLRLNSAYTEKETDYIRWTNYETGETGVKFTDKYGEWKRVSFTSGADGVSITKLTKSSEGQLLNLTVSIDDINDVCKAWDGMSEVSAQKYKKMVPEDCSYIAQMAHYPAYSGSELYDGGYGGVTLVIAEGEKATKTKVITPSADPMLVGENAAIQIENAEAVYLITVVDRTFEMTGAEKNVMAEFIRMTEYPLLTEMVNIVTAVAEKYTKNSKFSYKEALAPSAALQAAEFNRVEFNLYGDEEFSSYDNDTLIATQRKATDRINHEFMRRAYEQARYAMICCGGTTAPRLYGMWTGEWNPGWRGIYTLDANVNLQVSAMNTGNLDGDFQEGYITFFLRHTPDFMENATMAYGMHDAIQLSVNADADRAMHVEYDNAYPFEYWNAGASWCLLPIYEYWQCYGNQQIPINEYMRIENLQGILSVNDGGLTDAEFRAILERGYLDLEKDILLPLLTKQANFWEQIVTPRYYTDVNGKACHDENKTELQEGEKYIILPAYSPENSPIGYNSTITANATMDISAAKDGLDMVCALEKAVGREGWEAAVEKWQLLKSQIADYKTDKDGALREWAMDEYIENNNHRHLSHLYVAWPAYDTQNDPALELAANIALDNRNKYNTGDATAGHGWMHKALVEARLKRGDGMMKSLLKMMNGTAYYSSFMTDHDTNRRNDTYCTDTAFGTLGAVNEALVFSNTGQIEIIPALPEDWTGGTVKGLMARCRTEVTELVWNTIEGVAVVTLLSSQDNNVIRLSCGEAWTKAVCDGKELTVLKDENGVYVEVVLDSTKEVTVTFTLSDTLDGTYLIEKEGVYLQAADTVNGSVCVWGELSDNAYWSIKNIGDGFVTIQNCATGKYLTRENGEIVQKNMGENAEQQWTGSEFMFVKQNFLKEVTVVPDSIMITVDGTPMEEITLKGGSSVQLAVETVPQGALTALQWESDSIGHGSVTQDGVLTCYEAGEFTVTATSNEGYVATLMVSVTGETQAAQKVAVRKINGADSGYSRDWSTGKAIDGLVDTAYASSDTTKIKWLQLELEEAAAVEVLYLIGRFTPGDGNGTYAGRINGAKVYASNEKLNGKIENAVLVGRVSGVSATDEYLAQAVRVDTQGEKYRYYTIYFDLPNNGQNISMAVAEIALYTGGAKRYMELLSPQVSSFGSGEPGLATDGNTMTVFSIANQTEDTIAEQYIRFDFDGESTIDRLVIKKAELGGNYWQDHSLSVGCEWQGSFDGVTWETMAVMNTWPDGTDYQNEVVFEFTDAKAYRYVRYIRTTVKKNGDYAYWLWADSDGGNRLSLAEVEFYTLRVE